MASGAPIDVRDDWHEAACASYAGAHAEASAYHDPAWLGVIRRAFGHDAMLLTAVTEGRIAGLLPVVFFRSPVFGRFAVSLPFVNYGGLLASSPEAAAALLARAVVETGRRGGSHLELRHTRVQAPAFRPRRHKVAMTLALSDTADAGWARLDRKVRNQVRKAEKGGVSVVHGGPERLGQFYEVFAHNMRDLGTPVYSMRFFREVLTTFPGTTRVFVAIAGGRPAAASIVHWHRDTIEVPWASAIREFNPLCVNVLLYWEMVRFAIERGFRTFDFGRSTPDEGTFHFKRQWGAEPQPLVWEYWDAPGRAVTDLSPKNPKFELAIRLWQRLPVRVATAIGPSIVRNIP